MWWRALTHATSAKADKTTKTGTQNSVRPFESSYLALWTFRHVLQITEGGAISAPLLRVNASGTHDDVTGLNKLCTLVNHKYTFNLSLTCFHQTPTPQMRRGAHGGGATFTVRRKKKARKDGGLPPREARSHENKTPETVWPWNTPRASEHPLSEAVTSTCSATNACTFLLGFF